MTQVLNTQGQQSPKTGSAGKHGHQLLTEFYREMLNAIFTNGEDVMRIAISASGDRPCGGNGAVEVRTLRKRNCATPNRRAAGSVLQFNHLKNAAAPSQPRSRLSFQFS
ncbi:hypothetical protein [Rhizobium sp. SL42]|uniref:hypothetical protein n=1 Tax=Rhizobium sp. SL42 TaxID=2806346 RepID=UPI001F352190|nr:hypothetical protein [Rhizobium sp. SL42]UJW76051.1 hypothetical protein IM739_06080 [Rhizobium sp. SL42]